MTLFQPFHSHKYVRECPEILAQRLRVECCDLSPPRRRQRCWWPPVTSGERVVAERRGGPTCDYRSSCGHFRHIGQRGSAAFQSGDKSPHSITLTLLATHQQWPAFFGCSASPCNAICGFRAHSFFR